MICNSTGQSDAAIELQVAAIALRQARDLLTDDDEDARFRCELLMHSVQREWRLLTDESSSWNAMFESTLAATFEPQRPKETI